MRQDAKRILPERQREKESERKLVAQHATIIRAGSPIAVIISRQSSEEIIKQASIMEKMDGMQKNKG